MFQYNILATIVHSYSIVDGPSWQSQYPETRYINSHEANYIRAKLLQAMIKSVEPQANEIEDNYVDRNELKPMLARQKISSAISKNELDKITNAMRNRLFGFK
uniref:Uncharacterized protein n=1 Tax=Ditylenchus dipsaci TaxID=166011 RepID=A0A915D1G0_9BILA